MHLQGQQPRELEEMNNSSIQAKSAGTILSFGLKMLNEEVHCPSDAPHSRTVLKKPFKINCPGLLQN